MNKVEIDRLLSKLKEFDALRDSDRINRNEVNRIQAAYAEEWPSQLNPAVRNALLAAGIQKPYQHQEDAKDQQDSLTESLFDHSAPF